MNLNDTYKLGRSARYSNPRTTGDYLPIVWGDMKGGNKGIWVCPCIDTVNFYYLIADHPILPAANGNSFTVYDKDGVEISPADYTIVDDHTDENGKHVSIISFTADHESSEPISIRCKGRNSGTSLIENPISIVEDFVENFAGGTSTDFDSTTLQKAKNDTSSYLAAGILSEDKTIGEVITEILGSFYTEWWVNSAGKIVIIVKKIHQSFDWKAQIYERNVTNFSAQQKRKNICNQAEVNYAYNYVTNSYEEVDDGSSTKSQLSQNIYGELTQTFDFKWCRDLTTVNTVQANMVGDLKDPTWLIQFDEVKLENLHIERGDFILINHTLLYDITKNPFNQRIVQVLGKTVDLNTKKITFNVMDCKRIYKNDYLYDGTYLFDGTIDFGLDYGELAA